MNEYDYIFWKHGCSEFAIEVAFEHMVEKVVDSIDFERFHYINHVFGGRKSVLEVWSKVK